MGGIRYDESKTPSLCDWLCGKAKADTCTPYWEHFSNILSALDFNGRNREETYWLIYQLLTVVYKYSNHTQRSDMERKSRTMRTEDFKVTVGGRNVSMSLDEDNASTSESDS